MAAAAAALRWWRSPRSQCTIYIRIYRDDRDYLFDCTYNHLDNRSYMLYAMLSLIYIASANSGVNIDCEGWSIPSSERRGGGYIALSHSLSLAPCSTRYHSAIRALSCVLYSVYTYSLSPSLYVCVVYKRDTWTSLSQQQQLDKSCIYMRYIDPRETRNYNILLFSHWINNIYMLHQWSFRCKTVRFNILNKRVL